MTTRDEVARYLDADGLVSLSPTVPGQRNASGNGLLYLSLYYICLWLRGEAVNGDWIDFSGVLRSCEVAPGLLRRGPVQNDQESHDDYRGVIVACHTMGLFYPERIYAYGKPTWVRWGLIPIRWFYNNLVPGSAYKPDGKFNMGAWLGRNVSLMCVLHWACGQKPGLIRQVVWAQNLFREADRPKTDQDAWLMNWLEIQVYPGESRMCDRAVEYWKSRLLEHYPSGIREVVAICTRDPMRPQPEDHPIARYWPA